MKENVWVNIFWIRTGGTWKWKKIYIRISTHTIRKKTWLAKDKFFWISHTKFSFSVFRSAYKPSIIPFQCSKGESFPNDFAERSERPVEVRGAYTGSFIADHFTYEDKKTNSIKSKKKILAHLDAKGKQSLQLVFQVIPNHSKYLFYVSCKLLFEKQSWILGLNRANHCSRCSCCCCRSLGRGRRWTETLVYQKTMLQNTKMDLEQKNSLIYKRHIYHGHSSKQGSRNRWFSLLSGTGFQTLLDHEQQGWSIGQPICQMLVVIIILIVKIKANQAWVPIIYVSQEAAPYYTVSDYWRKKWVQYPILG